MSDILIIGGGIMGMLTARYLNQQGASVTLLEKGRLGQESSWAGGGIVSPLYPWRYPQAITDLATFGQQNYANLAAELLENTGIDPEYCANGLMIIAPDEEKAALNWAEKYQQKLHIVDLAKMQQLEPSRHFTETSAIWMPDVGQLRNPRLVKSLAADIIKRGVKIVENTPVEDFKINPKTVKIESVQSQNKHHQADQFIVCGGAWSAEILQKTHLNLNVEPVLGQMICFNGQPQQILRIILEKDRYIIPRRDGKVLFGSTLEHVGFNKVITKSAKAELMAIAIKAHPILKKMSVAYHWAGLRPATKAGIPYIGQHPAYQNLYFNCGQYRNGVVIGLGSCRLMAEIIMKKSLFIDPTAYAVL